MFKDMLLAEIAKIQETVRNDKKAVTADSQASRRQISDAARQQNASITEQSKKQRAWKSVEVKSRKKAVDDWYYRKLNEAYDDIRRKR